MTLIAKCASEEIRNIKTSLGVSVCLHISYIWVVTSQPPARVAARLVSYCFCCDATAPLRQGERFLSTRESHSRVDDLRHPRLGKPRRGLQIMNTRKGFLCPLRSEVIDSINPT